MLAALWFAGAGAPPVAASCPVPQPPDEALATSEVAFVGRVVSTANDNRWATVAVDEIWSGPALTPVVEVRGGAEPGVGTSVDRSYQVGVTYLFLIWLEDGRLVDNACSSTLAWEPTLEALRPATARAPVGGSDQDADGPGAIVPFLVVALGAGVLGIVALGWRSR